MKLVRPMFTALALVLAGIVTEAQTNCLKVDLQAVSISPVSPSVQSGKMTRVEVVMLNNGPCEIPRGEATAQITINTEHLEIPSNPGFTDDCGSWTFVTATTSGNSKNLFFRNNGAALPVGSKSCAFYFNVKAKSKSPGISTVTLASSLSASAKTSDMNGNNQSAYTEINIQAGTDVADPKIPSIKNKSEIKLEGKSKECTALLRWETNSPDIESFEIQTGLSKTSFEKLADLENNDIAIKNHTYETEQGNAHKFYRVKIIYKDGSSDYSTVTEIESKCKVKKGFLP